VKLKWIAYWIAALMLAMMFATLGYRAGPRIERKKQVLIDSIVRDSLTIKIYLNEQ